MSYGAGAAFQSALFALLTTDPVLAGLVGGAIYDEVPAGLLPEIYISLGSEIVRDRSDKSGFGAEHEFTISVVSAAAGYQAAKQAAAAVSDRLVDAPLILTRGTLVSLGFYRAVAARIDSGSKRQINLIFRARIDDN